MGKLASCRMGIEGLYEWGSGWTSDKANVWKEFWLSKVDSHKQFEWLVHYSNCSWGTDFFLVSLYGGFMIHPMGDGFILETSNSAENEKFESEIKSLAKLLDELAVFVKDRLDIDLKYAIEWKVLKEEYNPKRYIPDSDDGSDDVHRVANY